MDSPASTRLPRPTSTPRTQPSRCSKNHARPLSLPRAFRELGLRSPPASRTRPALPPLGLRPPPAGQTHPAPPARPAGSGRRHRDAGSACASPPANAPCAVAAPCRLRRASPPANAPCTAAPPCGLRPPPPPGRAQGGAGAGHCRRDVRRPLPPGRAPAAGTTSAAVTPAIFFGIFGSIFGDFSFFTLEAKSREICLWKLLLGHLWAALA